MAAIIVGGLLVGVGVAAAAAIFGGGSSAENVITQTLNDLVTVCTVNISQCNVSSTQLQSFTIVCGTGATCNTDILASQNLVMQPSCINAASVSNNLKQLMSAQASQSANAISSAFSLSKSKSANVSNIVSNLTNVFASVCNISTTQQQVVSVTGEANSTVNTVANVSQYTQNTAQCVSDNQSVNNTSQDLYTAINQSATSKVRGFLMVLLGIILLGGAIIALIIFVLLIFKSLKKSKHTTPQPNANVDSIGTDADIKALLAINIPGITPDTSPITTSSTSSTLPFIPSSDPMISKVVIPSELI